MEATDATASSRITIVSRAKDVTNRLKRVRAAWFVLGMLVGVGGTLFADHLLVRWQSAGETDVLPEEEITAPTEQGELIEDEDPFPKVVDLKVASGDTLLAMLVEAGIASEEAHDVVAAVKRVHNPQRLSIGQKINVELEPSTADPKKPILSFMDWPISRTSTVKLKRNADGSFKAERIDAPVKKKIARTSTNIRGSLYQAAGRAGIPRPMVGEIIKAFSYDVDFQRDIKEGNRLDVVFERMETEDGIVTAHGALLYAGLTMGKRKVAVYRYTDKGGNTDYYNSKGESVRKALLRTPINSARISSGFGMRLHPILGYTRMHRGVDFAAPHGTPIYAAGDGTIATAAVQSGYGNYVKLKHNDKYSTAYAHLSRFGKGIKAGVKVKQGQIIGYVGSTGSSTGAHLHYEVLVGSNQVNPAGVKFKTGNVLGGKELADFKGTVGQVQAALGEGKSKPTKVAKAEGKSKKAVD